MIHPDGRFTYNNNGESKLKDFPAEAEQSQQHGQFREVLGVGSEPVSDINSSDISHKNSEVFAKFTWNYGGNQVLLTGEFYGWKKSIPL